ncbi:MAG: site-specific integrase, partial [Mesorhizobium sp.]
MGDITRAEIIAHIDDIYDGGKPIAANRTLAALKRLFSWCVERDLIPSSPCDRVKAPSAEQSRDRILTDAELQAVWKASEGLGWPFGPMVQMLVLTGQRRNEVSGMRWEEIDLKGKLWSLPRERAKNDQPHSVPLSAPAIELLESLPRIEGQDFVFSTTGTTPVSGFSRMKRGLDAKVVAALREEAEERKDDPAQVSVADWWLHDLRRTCASGMARIGINLPVIEKVLNHVSGSFAGIVGVYQRHSFDDEKRAALDAWGNFI